MSWGQLGTGKAASGQKVEKNKQIIMAVPSTLLLTGKGLSQESLRMDLPCTCPPEEPELWLVLFNFISLFCSNLSAPILFLLFQPWSKNALRVSASPCEHLTVTAGTKLSPWLCSSVAVFSESRHALLTSSVEGRRSLWKHRVFLSCVSASCIEGRGFTINGVAPGFSACFRAMETYDLGSRTYHYTCSTPNTGKTRGEDSC